MNVKSWLHSKPLVFGGVLVIMLMLFMLTGLFYTPYEPNEMNTSMRLAPPQTSHIWGTDNFGGISSAELWREHRLHF